MKIVVLIDAWSPIWRGGQVHSLEIAKRLTTNFNCRVEILTPALIDEKGQKFDKSETFFQGRLKVVRLKPALYFTNFWARVSFLPRIIFYLLANDFDLINIQSFSLALPAKVVSIFKRKPLVFTFHLFGKEIIGIKENKFLKTFFNFLQDLVLFNIKYDAQITVNREFLRFKKNENKKIFYIPNGVEIEKFNKVKAKKSKFFKILFVGQLSKQKGVKDLLKAFKKVILKEPKIKLFLVGKGELDKNLKLLAADLGLTKFTYFLGELKGRELVKQYKSSHLFVLPSIYEGQPISILEAWAAKLPVVVTRVGDNESLVREGINGFLAKPGNVGSLARAIIKAISNPLLARIGENGYKFAQKNFSWDKIALKTFKILKRVHDDSQLKRKC